MELSNSPGCYVWNPNLQPDTTPTWTGECVEGLAQGTGTLNWVWFGDRSRREETGRLQAGKYHGQWVVRGAGGRYVEEGPYVEGKRHGQWVVRQTEDGFVEEGPYVKGKRHGRWVWRYASGTVHEGPYVEGEQHGRWVWRYPAGHTRVTIYNRGMSVRTITPGE